MKKRLMVQVFLMAALAAPLSMFANSVQIQYQATNISGDEWSYTYKVTSAPFAANEAFTVFFGLGSYSNLQAAPPSPSGWSTFSLQPDAILFTNGLYTALALTPGASLAGPFTITFDYLGLGTPGSQAFSVDQFDSNGNLISNVTTGFTTPLSQTVPEPATGLLLLAGGAAVVVLKKQWFGQAG
jgi:hypothetical protein